MVNVYSNKIGIIYLKKYRLHKEASEFFIVPFEMGQIPLSAEGFMKF